MKKLSMVLCACAVLVLIAGCNKQKASSTGTGLQPTHVTVWHGSWWEPEKEHVEREFAEENPGWTVTVELQPINAYLENAVTAIAGGNPPDVLTLDTLMMPSAVAQGLLRPLDDFMKKYNISKDIFVAANYDSGVTNGINYAIPYRYAPSCLFYNKTLFDTMGVPYPAPRMNPDDFLEMCKKMTDPSKFYAFGISADKADFGNVISSIAPWLWSFGGDFMNKDLTKCALDTPESIAGITYWVELYTKYKVVPPGCINYTNTRDLFPMAMNQQIAFIRMGESNVVGVDRYAKENNFEWGVTLYPGYTRAAGWSFTVPITAKNPDASEYYINYYIKPEVLGRNNTVMPSVIAAQKIGKWGDPLYTPYYEQMDYAINCPNTPKWSEMQVIIAQELQNALLEIITPEQAARNMAAQINALL
jgi:multiple sugar transport system substrate-binding protein